MMIIQGFLFFVITVLIEYRFFIPQRLVYFNALFESHFLKLRNQTAYLYSNLKIPFASSCIARFMSSCGILVC